MNFKTLNKEHKEILDDFTNDVEGFIYKTTKRSEISNPL